MNKYFAAVSLGALAAAVSVASCKCSKNEDIPPMPSATAVATPETPAELVPTEDAGADADAADGDAGDGDAKKATGTADPTRLLACCRALAQNAKSAPITQQALMLQAAATCEAAARSGNLAAASAALRSAGFAGCK